jgi:HK97 gp10 family phage protein
MFDVETKIEGVELLNAKLNAVSREIQYKGGRFGLRKAAKLVAADVKSNALRLDDPKTANQIAKNVAVRWSPRRFKRTGDLMFRVGILGGAAPSNSREAERSRRRRRRAGVPSLAELGELVGKGKGNPGGDTWYWRLLEFGFYNKKAKRKIAAQPFMRSALKNNINAATKEFVRHSNKAIDRAVKKAGGK